MNSRIYDLLDAFNIEKRIINTHNIVDSFENVLRYNVEIENTILAKVEDSKRFFAMLQNNID